MRKCYDRADEVVLASGDDDVRDGNVANGSIASNDDRWTVKARTRTPMEVMSPVFDLLAGVTPVENGNRRLFDDRVGRALVAPWKLPAGAQSGGPLPTGVRRTLQFPPRPLRPRR